MINKSDSSNLSQSTCEKPKDTILISFFMGALTFVLYPLVLVITFIISFALFKISKNLNPMTFIIKIFDLENKQFDGFILSILIPIALIGLLSNFGVAMISWFRNRSMKLATITFFSAILFQIIYIAIFYSTFFKKPENQIISNNKVEKIFEKYANIEDDINFKLEEPFTYYESVQRKFVKISVFKKLKIFFTISAKQAGNYRINLKYRDNKITNSPNATIEQYLNLGKNIIKIELLPHQSNQFGYFDDKLTKGSVKIYLEYLATVEEFIEKTTSKNSEDREFVENLFKERRMAKDAIVNEFVKKKEIKF